MPADPSSLPPLDAYPSRTTADIRYSDLDRQGHVNNAVFATFSEIGRVAFLYDPRKPLAPEGASFVIARLELDYHTELFWPGTVEIGTGVAGIGRSSVRITQGLFNGGRRVASAQAVIVLMDGRTRQSRPLPSETIERLKALSVPGLPPKA
jgi:acyl-CoA thioester hydrolase